MGEKKEWWEKLRDIAVAFMAIMAMLGFLWGAATNEIEMQEKQNANDIKKLQEKQSQDVTWNDIPRLNEELDGIDVEEKK